MKEVLIDRGFGSEVAVRPVEQDERGRPTGLTVLAAVKRAPHGRGAGRKRPRRRAAEYL